MNTPTSPDEQANSTSIYPAEITPPQVDLTIRPGQTDLEVKWALHGINKSDPDLAAMVYYARLVGFLAQNHDHERWEDILTPLQRKVMLQGRRCKERREYAKEKGGPVRSYRRDLNQTDDEKRADDAERKRRERAAKSTGPSRLRTDLSGMSAADQAEHRKKKNRERQQRLREEKRLTKGMTPDQLAQREEARQRADQAELLELVTKIARQEEDDRRDGRP